MTSEVRFDLTLSPDFVTRNIFVSWYAPKIHFLLWLFEDWNKKWPLMSSKWPRRPAYLAINEFLDPNESRRFMVLFSTCLILQLDDSSVFDLFLWNEEWWCICFAEEPEVPFIETEPPTEPLATSGFIIHQLDLPWPSFWTLLKRLCSDRLCRIEFWKENFDVNNKALEFYVN